MADLCPHRGVALSVGEVHGDCIWCPFHGFEFDASGRCTVIPANGRATPAPKALRVRTYPTYEMHGFIFLYWGEPEGEVAPPRWFEDLEDGFSCGAAHDLWNAHYSRVIENRLDVPHVPFIHHNTIGRGGRTVMDGPWVQWQDPDRFFVRTGMREDDGTPARSAKETPPPDKPYHLEFLFPNLWQNWISEKVRVVAAFAPVDDEHTVLYLRFYQNFVRTPGRPELRQLVGHVRQHLCRPPGSPGSGDAAAAAQRSEDRREVDSGRHAGHRLPAAAARVDRGAGMMPSAPPGDAAWPTGSPRADARSPTGV